MKRKHIVYCCVATLAAWGAEAWLNRPPLAPLVVPPTISFVEFRESHQEKVAVFRIANDTNSPFCFRGWGRSDPIYSERVKTAKGWEDEGIGWCGTGVGYHTISPHTSSEFEVDDLDDEPAPPFAIGIHFVQGTAKQFKSRIKSQSKPSYMPEFFYWFRRFIPTQRPAPGPEPTWSDTVKIEKPEGDK